MRLLCFLLFLSFSFKSFSSEKEISVSQIEKVFLDEMKSKKLTEDESFHLYNLAARELYQYGYYRESQKYYEKALTLKSNRDKTENYINLLGIEFQLTGDITKKNFNRAMKYLKSSKKIQEPGISNYMQFIEGNFLTNNSKKNFVGFYGQFSKDRSFKKLVKNKEYKEALSLMNPTGIEHQDINTKMKYDIVNTLVYKEKTPNLVCQQVLAKHPNSFSWRMKTCKLLIRYKKGQKPKKKDIEDIRLSQEKFNETSRDYLVDALEDLI